MHTTIQTCYDLQDLIMSLIEYMNDPNDPAFLALGHGMEYLMHHQHEPIMYSRKRIFKTNGIPIQCLLKAGRAEIKQTQEYTSCPPSILQRMTLGN